MRKILYSIMALIAISFAFTSFTSCEDVPAPFKEPTEKQDTTVTPTVDSIGAGTRQDPFNVAAAVKYISGHGSEDVEVYVKGIVVSVVKGSYDASYGSLKYYISDDGTETNTFYVFNGYAGANRKKFTSEDDLQYGDTVVICGKLVNYNGTSEFTTGNYIVSLNGKNYDTGDSSEGVPTGDGTEANPFNSVAANDYVSKLDANVESDKDIYIKGKIVSVKEAYGTQYGNATFYISDDGKADNQFCVYRALYLGNQKYTSGTNVQAGDDVVVCGKVVKYVKDDYGTTYETASGKAYLVSLKSNGSSDDSKPASDALTIDGTTVTLADVSATAGTESISVDCSALGYTNQQDVTTITLSDGTTVTFDKNGETNGPKYYDVTKGFRVYKNNKITFAGAKKIAKVVLTCDTYNGTDYVGNATATVEISGNDIIYTNVFTGTSGGGVQLRIKNIKIVYAQ